MCNAVASTIQSWLSTWVLCLMFSSFGRKRLVFEMGFALRPSSHLDLRTPFSTTTAISVREAFRFPIHRGYFEFYVCLPSLIKTNIFFRQMVYVLDCQSSAWARPMTLQPALFLSWYPTTVLIAFILRFISEICVWKE